MMFSLGFKDLTSYLSKMISDLRSGNLVVLFGILDSIEQM